MNKHRLIFVTRLVVGLLVSVAAHADPTAEREFQTQLDLALHGNTGSQYRIGEMYEHGIGTRRDTAMAYLWYNKAAIQGNLSAKQKLESWDSSKGDGLDEKSRVDAAMRALQQQSERETARQREKERIAAEARAREKAAAEAAAAARLRATSAPTPAPPRARAPTPAAATAPAAAVAPIAVTPQETNAASTEPTPAPAPAPTKPPAPQPNAASKPATPDDPEFSTNPCKGPQARFLSTCN
jgi:hypothetical protein